MSKRCADILRAIRDVYGVPEGAIPLHAPVFSGNEQAYVRETIASTFVSSVGEFVDRFEAMLEDITGARHAIATSTGTGALQIALTLAGVRPGDLVLTQPLTFVATANAIVHAGGRPVFLDVEEMTLGLSPAAVAAFLESRCHVTDGVCRLRGSGERIAACLPMHTFGHPCRVDALVELCRRWSIPVVEDAAEALGSWHNGRAVGTFGLLGVLSFNGNKICTCGGGGAILTDDEELGRLAKHLTTTAKVPHRWNYVHDMIGHNLRLPNLNAALGCAQLEQLNMFADFKIDLARRYQERFRRMGIPFVAAPPGTRSNYWLSTILLENETERDAFLTLSNDDGVQTRPAWAPLHTLPMYADARREDLPVTTALASRLVNIPSGFRA